MLAHQGQRALRRYALYFSFKRSYSSDSSAFVNVTRDEENGKPTGVAVIRLNRPKILNALTVDVGNQFQAAIAELSAATDVRAVVLTGEGKAFSAGGDLEFLMDRTKSAAQFNSEEMRRFYQRFLDVRKLPVPVISAINGPAIGAGLCLALATDVRITSATNKLGVTFVSLGLHPGMGATHFLPALIGNQNASRLLLTGEVISGTEAEKIGLVASVVEKDENVLPAALTLARKIARQSSVAVRSTVRSLRSAQDADLERALWREADAQAHCYAAEDIKEGINAIREKRAPDFTTKK
eukprot:Phypoly_transcript_13573.p1 GENE.Phypoly_transcript_13573~~Phypoly_transcript_13573.p1  ORF type:complete len:296 (+),score=49.42 Phypoly_transcript_13573:92-979(+)